ncbi:hypothetical protein [Pseudoxanthomonas kalamensis]|uniref:hypothetical protein n=1 Tax=Pseudoxanthomonas kalamensis TaxID=289483 RepID=UPI001B8810B8|nr:hypothetical protein [Pseudoxanthomonas kalamensis]
MTPNALLLTLALAATPALAAQDISKVNGSITAEAGQSYGDLETVNGSIRIQDGAVVEDAGTVNGSITVDAKATTGDLETVNGSIRLGEHVTVRGGIDTVNGAVFIDRGGEVKDGVETVNGAIGLVATRVGGGIETVNGDITVGIDSHVRGGITVEKPNSRFGFKPKRDPRVVIGPNAVVEGPLVFERPVVLYVHKSARTGPVRGATARVFEGNTAPQD